MIIGSGLLAQAFEPGFGRSPTVCIYSAGVSNSACEDPAEFEREHERLAEALQRTRDHEAFVYFGTCSVMDPEANHTPYVQHKLRMEQCVAAHPRHLIMRLPQVVGRTPNPHTLLNFLYARISRSEAFRVWSHARRNIIDVRDVAAIGTQLIRHSDLRRATVNVANSRSYAVTEIVAALEAAAGKSAVYEAVDRGSSYEIDITGIRPFLERAGVRFDDGYLQRIVDEYYGKQ